MGQCQKKKNYKFVIVDSDNEIAIEVIGCMIEVARVVDRAATRRRRTVTAAAAGSISLEA